MWHPLDVVQAVFMFGGGDVAVADSVETASSFMEAADIEAGEYDGIYDDTGLVYEAQVQGYQVHLIPTDARDYNGLVERLSSLAEQVGLTFDSHSPEFAIEAARQIAKIQWEQRWPRRPRWMARRIHGSAPRTFHSD